jgi:3'-phosphoadenosine 5'-phosphosulfate sulfotransferase (PAPS reductase)/FAD synthetase
VNDPFKIIGPALLSVSGGETSMYMLKRVIDAHGGALPDGVFAAFANTGKEREETLRFVHECSVRWNVHIHWLEFVTDLRRPGAAARFKEVGFNSAGRNGEPFDRLITRKSAIPSTVSGRWCTQFLKVGVLQDFMAVRGFGSGDYTEVIGFRADEADRVFELPVKHPERRLAFPLADAGVVKAEVRAFWDLQDFRLELRRGFGNCDHCPFLSKKSRVTRLRHDPRGAGWWVAHEFQRNGFTFGRESFAEIAKLAKQSPLLPMDELAADVADTECVGWCGA